MSDTESFESVINNSFEIAKAKLQIAFEGRLLERLLSDLQAAHDREIRDVGQREYHRGYVDGCRHRETATWQLDRERLQVARRLREIEPSSGGFVKSLAQALGIEWTGQRVVATIAEVRDRLIHLLGGDSNLQESPNPINKDAESPSYFMESADFNKLGDREKVVRKLKDICFDGGSHENLSRIAYAIYPCATGWTCESTAGLRDSLVRLIERDDGGACVSEHVRNSDKPDADSDSHNELAEGITAYDVLGNERHKAIAKLQKIPNAADSSYTYDEHIAMIYDALDVDAEPLSYSELDETRDNLIHLLGGDQPSGIDAMNSYEQRIENLTRQRDELSRKLEVIREYGVEVAGAAGGGYEVYDKTARERDELKERCRNQQKQLAEFNRVMNTWHWDIKSHKQ